MKKGVEFRGPIGEQVSTQKPHAFAYAEHPEKKRVQIPSEELGEFVREHYGMVADIFYPEDDQDEERERRPLDRAFLLDLHERFHNRGWHRWMRIVLVPRCQSGH